MTQEKVSPLRERMMEDMRIRGIARFLVAPSGPDPLASKKSKRSPRPIDVFSLGRLTLFGVVRLRARQGVLGELISEGVATA